MWEIAAPCKINVHLQVKGRRPDGYHNLESIFLALALGDTLRFELGGDDGACAIQVDWKNLPGMAIPPDTKASLASEKNIVYQAVSLFRERIGFNRGLRVHLEKRIPLGAGLGGGSSDAASTLKALNVLAGTGLSLQVLGEMAESLGSDVPFFLVGGAALVSGRGERIRPLKAPEGLSVVLVYPGFSSNTVEAYRLLDEARTKEGWGEGATGTAEELINALSENPRGWPYRNDFLPVFLSAGEEKAAEAYGSILGDLARWGADFSGLSGSGSTCFGIFSDGGMAEQAAKVVAHQRNWVVVTFPLARFSDQVLE
jgi:4-diphosphocytidyl-2-C-methyl-D-erythritol kinase